MNGNGHKKDEEPPVFVEPPESVTRFFDGDLNGLFIAG